MEFFGEASLQVNLEFLGFHERGFLCLGSLLGQNFNP